MKKNLAWLTWVGLGGAVIGYFTPWINPVPAALKLSGYDLVEWLTFAGGVRDGSFAVTRVDLLLPLICLSWLVAFQAHSTQAGRYLFVFVSFLLAGLVLPTYPFILTAHTDPELRPQLIAGLVALSGAPVWATLPRAQSTWVTVSGGSLAVIGMVCTLRAFALAQPVFQDVFTHSSPINYGIILCVSGFTFCALSEGLKLYGRMRDTTRV